MTNYGTKSLWRSVVAEWSKSVAFKAGVSQRRFESGRRQTVTVTACTLWQGSLNLSATSPMTTSDAETDVKLNIHFFSFLCFTHFLDEKLSDSRRWGRGCDIFAAVWCLFHSPLFPRRNSQLEGGGRSSKFFRRPFDFTIRPISVGLPDNISFQWIA